MSIVSRSSWKHFRAKKVFQAHVFATVGTSNECVFGVVELTPSSAVKIELYLLHHPDW